MIQRTLAPSLRQRASLYPVVTLAGPRQSGKTTLCRMLFPDKPYLSLEALEAILVEAKSGQTLITEFFKHLETFAANLRPGPASQQRLVYGGDLAVRRSGVQVIPWRDIQKAGWA